MEVREFLFSTHFLVSLEALLNSSATGNGALSRALRPQGMAMTTQLQIASRFISTLLLFQYGTLQTDLSPVIVLARLVGSKVTDYSLVDWDLIPITIRNFSHPPQSPDCLFTSPPIQWLPENSLIENTVDSCSSHAVEEIFLITKCRDQL